MSIAIVDYGVGNLFSVTQACAAAGLSSAVTEDADVIRRSQAVVLPGIGAFGDAMAALSRLNLVDCLRRLPEERIPLVGICLGMQLLMERSEELGSFEGLGLVSGSVKRLRPANHRVKVPQVGWNRVRHDGNGAASERWSQSLLRGVADGEAMYFVHSYVVVPANGDVALARSTYGEVDFCSALETEWISGFQFHPERSGGAGLQIYRNLAARLQQTRW
jgi:imidazole glycerol-phosphate synthase subunit HisH